MIVLQILFQIILFQNGGFFGRWVRHSIFITEFRGYAGWRFLLTSWSYSGFVMRNFYIILVSSCEVFFWKWIYFKSFKFQDSQFEFDQQFTLPSQGWTSTLPEVGGDQSQELVFVDEEEFSVPGQLPTHACRYFWQYKSITFAIRILTKTQYWTHW